MPKIIDRGITVLGHVVRPGVTAWRDGIRISEVLSKADDLLPHADARYVIVRREDPQTRRIEVLSVNLEAAWSSVGGPADLQLAARDSLYVFDASATRRPLLDPLLEELRRQASLGDPAPIVTVGGRVHSPGDYPLEAGMRVSDLVRAGGRITDQAFPDKAELTRYKSNGRERVNELLEIDLAAILAGDLTADVELQPYDVLVIKELPEWAKREVVTLRGEVRFPGEYPIRRGETLRSLLERAGGLTALAYPRGSVFTRLELRQREELRNRELAQRLQRDLAATSVQALQASQRAENATAATAAQSLLAQLQTTEAVGRLVINLDGVIAGGIGSRADIILRDGDVLAVPKIPQEVTVLGEVQNSTSHLFRSGLSTRDYIDLSGGFSQRADAARSYVIRADGSVVTPRKTWLGASRTAILIQPGDTIVAPMDVERLPPLPLWQAITSIVYNAAVALAAINSL
jgi:protein involved in polysaccharide export with SLBB domain